MKSTEIKDICLNGSKAYYNSLASRQNGGVEEIEISKIEKINQETYKVVVAKKLFEIDSVSFRYNGKTRKTFTTDDIQIKVYDNDKKTLIVKVSQDVQQYISLLTFDDWKIIIDLKFLVQRVIDWYEINGDKLSLYKEKISNEFDESVIFPDDPPSKEQRNAIEMLFSNYLSYVWGAPGTGKTRFVLSYSILSYIKKEKKVLVLAPTNVALEQVLSGVLEMTDKANLKREKILRLGFPSSEFADKYGEICEIQGLEKELKSVNDQIKILSSILGIESDKENSLRKNISILTKLIEINSKLNTKIKIKHEISSNISKQESNRRSFQLKLQILEKEKQNLIKKKNSILRKILGSITKQINYDREIEIIIQKQIGIEDSLSELNKSIRDNESRLITIQNDLISIRKAAKENGDLLEESGVIENVNSIDASSILETLKNELRREIEDQQVYKSLSKEYTNLSPPQLRQLLNQFLDKKRKLEDYSLETRIENSLVVGATIDTFLHRFKEGKIDFEHIFVDEAGYASIVKALTVFTSKTPVTLLGDHKQLPPVCEISMLDIQKNGALREVFIWDQSAIFIGDFWNSENLDDALYIYLNETTPSTSHLPKSSLTESFRFGPNLAKVLDHYVYEEGFNSKKEANTEIILCNVSNPPEARGRGRLNEAEVLAIQNLVKNKINVDDSVAILAPYNDQIKALKELIPDFRDENKILTVHKSQGREWDTVIYSVCDIGNGKPPWFTDSTSKKSNGLNNINTAVSRAKRKLIICCCEQEWSCKSDQLVKGLLDASTSRIDYDSSKFKFSQTGTNHRPRSQNANPLSKSKVKQTSNIIIKGKDYLPSKPDEEWESKTLHWSRLKKPGYTFSTKKGAWWKKK